MNKRGGKAGGIFLSRITITLSGLFGRYGYHSISVQAASEQIVLRWLLWLL